MGFGRAAGGSAAVMVWLEIEREKAHGWSCLLGLPVVLWSASWMGGGRRWMCGCWKRG